MADSVNEPASVDYTSRDFYSLRDDLRLRIKEILPAWGGEDPADFGYAMVEAFSYMGDVVNYYLDRVANESYLPTATQRQSILNIAANYGYVPAGYRAASTTVQFTNSSENQVVLPANTQLLGNIAIGDTVVDLIWSLDSAATIPGAVGETVGLAEVTAYNYEDISLRPENAQATLEGGGLDPTDVAGELIAVSNGQPEQRYILSENQVIDGSVEVYVKTGEIFEPWTKVDHLTDFGPFDSVFTVTTDAENFVFVNFGDGVSGTIPNKFSEIKAVYKIGGGSAGNIAENLITELYRVPGLDGSEVAALGTTLEITNVSTGIGGQGPESNASIKENAPQALTALNRAVSLADYQALALQVPDVGKAKAVADYWTSVTVYVSPQRNPASVDQFPGFTDDPNDGGVLLQEWYDIQDAVQQFYTNKTQIGTSITVSPPTYVNASLELFYTKFDQYQEVSIETQMLKSVLDYFAYNNASFGDIIHPEEIESFISQIPGVRNASISGLYRTDGGSGRNILIGEPNEIFVFLTDNIVISPLSSNATLTSLTSSVGSLAPTFSPDFFNYSIVVPNGTTTLNLTATTSVDSSTLTINGDPAESGVADSQTITVGSTAIPIGVRAADGITFNEYVVTITRNA